MDRIERFTEWKDALKARIKKHSGKWWLLIFLLIVLGEEIVRSLYVQSATWFLSLLLSTLSELAARPMAVGGLALMVWLAVLSGLAYWETRPPKLDAPTKEKRALEEEVREKDRQLEQHIEAMKYGTILLHAEPLSPADQKVLSEPMRELRPFVDRASEALQRLLGHLLGKMQAIHTEQPQRDPRYWLAIDVREGALNRIKIMQERFDAKVESEDDPREALTGFIVAYQKGEEWAKAMGTFLNKPINDSEEYHLWKPCDAQLAKAFKETITLPQLKPIGQYLNSRSRLEAIMLEGLPSGLDQ